MDKQIESMLESAQIKPEGGSQAGTLQLSFMVPGRKPYADQVIFTKHQNVLDVIHKLRCLANRIESECIEKIGARMLMQSDIQIDLKYRQARRD